VGTQNCVDLFFRAVKICTNSAFLNKQISQISKFMAWNGFNANVRLSMIHKLKQRYAVDHNEDPQIENTASAKIGKFRGQ
jgi:hypothetical protein